MARRILVVEDDEKSRRLLADVLGFNGFDVIAAESGEQARVALGGRAPDAALLDIQLPGISGLRVLEQLRALPGPSSPILAVTASVMDTDRARILAAGFDAYVPKPVNIRELSALLVTLLAERTP